MRLAICVDGIDMTLAHEMATVTFSFKNLSLFSTRQRDSNSISNVYFHQIPWVFIKIESLAQPISPISVRIFKILLICGIQR